MSSAICTTEGWTLDRPLAPLGKRPPNKNEKLVVPVFMTLWGLRCPHRVQSHNWGPHLLINGGRRCASNAHTLELQWLMAHANLICCVAVPQHKDVVLAGLLLPTVTALQQHLQQIFLQSLQAAELLLQDGRHTIQQYLLQGLEARCS